MHSSAYDVPGATEFFQAIRLLERARPDAASLGADNRPGDEAVRFGDARSFAFPPSALDVGDAKPGTGRPHARVHFLSLLGACGVLPHHYTELALQRLSERDRALAEFLDLFLHRTVSFFYRGYKKYRLPFAYEAAQGRGGRDDITTVLLALVGLATPGLAQRPAEGADTWMYYAAHFSSEQRTAAGLESLLRHASGQPVRITEFVGRWHELADSERSALGQRHCTLGESCVLGSSAFDRTAGLRIEYGPMPMSALPRFSRSGDLAWLSELTHSYLGDSIDFEAVCVVDPHTIRPMCLGGGEDQGVLGAAAWLHGTRSDRYETVVPIGLDK